MARGEEGHDHIEARVIAAYRNGASNLTANLIAEREQGGETEWGYAVGARPDVDGGLGWGIEARGSLASGGSHEVLAGLYAAPSDRLQLKIGLGRGFWGDTSYWSVRTGLVVRLW